MTDTSDWRNAIDVRASAIFLDVDGTLLGFKDRPEDVIADAELRALLACVYDATGGATAFVSGRTIADIDRIMVPLLWPAAGVHGAELRFADGTERRHAGEALSDLHAKAETFVAERPGLRLEDKGGSTFAIHYRQAPTSGAEIARFLDQLVTREDVMVQHGKMVAEVKPRHCHKGVAIDTLLETPPFAGRMPIFIGDDLTDEHGFQAVNEHDGLSIKVGGTDEKSIARQRLADISEARELLAFICRSARLN